MKPVKTSLLIFAVMTLLLGIAYPLAMTGLAGLAFPGMSAGSLVISGGRVAGSALIGQKFVSPRYFHGRPSSVEYNAAGSGASNYGPANGKLVGTAAKAADSFRKENGLPANAPVPAGLVLASGSGLDPHIGVEAALLQAPRVARARGIAVSPVNDIVKKNIERRYFGLLGEGYVNVLRLNIALDKAGDGL